jgi:hypothetical protein
LGSQSRAERSAVFGRHCVAEVPSVVASAVFAPSGSEVSTRRELPRLELPHQVEQLRRVSPVERTGVTEKGQREVICFPLQFCLVPIPNHHNFLRKSLDIFFIVSTEFSTGMIATLFQRLTKPSLMQNSKHPRIDHQET